MTSEQHMSTSTAIVARAAPFGAACAVALAVLVAVPAPASPPVGVLDLTVTAAPHPELQLTPGGPLIVGVLPGREAGQLTGAVHLRNQTAHPRSYRVRLTSRDAWLDDALHLDVVGPAGTLLAGPGDEVLGHRSPHPIELGPGDGERLTVSVSLRPGAVGWADQAVELVLELSSAAGSGP
jgi:hypothetical protein